ncbi:3'-5' exonuclease [Shigella flexneri]
MVNRSVKGAQPNGGALARCAILYRSNAQSRVLEEALLQASMPYRIRADALLRTQENQRCALVLRLIANRDDDAALSVW